MKRAASFVVLAGLATGAALEPAPLAAFSAVSPGAALPTGWREVLLPNKKPPEFALVSDGGVTVLRVRSENAAGTVGHALQTDIARTLAWRWKVDRVVDKAELGTRAGDDFAARVYVFFDVPEDELAWGERLTLNLARLVHGTDLPSAGICYVWDNRNPLGTSIRNPYWYRIRTVVLESGNARVGRWIDERRDLESDFRAAFGAREGKPLPAVTGIAAGNDTDQTGETVTAWFGDFRLEARP